MRRSRGISSEMFLRLCTRAPCTAMVVRAAALGAPLRPGFAGREAAGTAFFRFRFTVALGVIAWFPQVKEGKFLHRDIALFRELDGHRGFAEEALVRQVLARRGHAAYVEVPPKMPLD